MKRYVLSMALLLTTAAVTAQAPLLLKNINGSKAIGSQPHFFTAYKGKTLFAATDDHHGNELWITDGTTAGTMLLRDLDVFPGSSAPGNFALFKDKVYFSTNDGNNSRLWSTDGTDTGTRLIQYLNGKPASYYEPMTVFKDRLYFINRSPFGTCQLYTSDGTTAGTQSLRGVINEVMTGVVSCRGRLYFTNYKDGKDTSEGLWTTDGTKAGTLQVSRFAAGPGLMVFNDKMYFIARSPGQGWELWSSDGTDAGTACLKIFFPGTQIRYALLL